MYVGVTFFLNIVINSFFFFVYIMRKELMNFKIFYMVVKLYKYHGKNTEIMVSQMIYYILELK